MEASQRLEGKVPILKVRTPFERLKEPLSVVVLFFFCWAGGTSLRGFLKGTLLERFLALQSPQMPLTDGTPKEFWVSFPHAKRPSTP